MVIVGRDSRSLLLVGLPDSGKTSFLAALWAVLEGELVEGSLKLHSVPTSSEYLTHIRSMWYRCVPPDHTPVGGLQSVELDLVSDEGVVLSVRIPDVSGETYREQFNTRKWPRELAELAEKSDGVTLLIHPDAATEPLPIAEANAELAKLDLPSFGAEQATEDEDEPKDEDATDEELHPESSEIALFSRDAVPPQVKMVDLLQTITFSFGKTPPVAVIISAWDLVEGQGESPKKWLADAMPLLSQYLHCLGRSAAVRIFGVSAQGGHYPTSANELLEVDVASRSRAVSQDGSTTGDITLPFRWLLDT